MNNIVWTIASSDSSAGAGIQADLHTIKALGADGCSVISAVTAQNSVAVDLVESVSDKMLIAQLDALASDMPAKIIKIGLIASIEHVKIIAEKLADYKANWDVAPFVIYDPVAVASTGDEMSEDGINEIIKTQLLPVVDLLTPNAKEVFTLSGHMLISGESLKGATEKLIEMGCKSVLIKGGHLPFLEDQCIDYYYDGEREIALTSPRLENVHSHGTGCTLASAIAATMAQNYFIEDALVIAKAYLNQGLKASKQLGKGEGSIAHLGWPNNNRDFPEVVLPESKVGYELDLQGTLEAGPGFVSCDTLKLGLYPVLDTVEWLEKVLKSGVKTLQLRIKDKQPEQVEQQIIDAIALGKKYDARMFINDYWQLAIKHQAYGVHLGQEDMDVADLGLIADAGLRLGLSTHGYYEILRAKQLKPSYIALGHIFETQTKDMPSDPQGLERLGKYAALLSDTPTVAIGGINLQRAPEVYKTGVGSIAVVTAITLADDYQSVIDEFNQIIK
ncbi:bifunctional hydroxymethylpyrimidine kinase/phosphomethylpyrimidine kinase [Psychromonas marina]|uniref:Thiamine-phosphate synthase n=1 Tax=Psychromonas marina TaxID=88364 RepID=A0ABQ6E0K8_9GAMM|nr:thiamine phosphate synthase [Psychromonas marina]GLS90882.1 bifunctional hydroxymethylpyrimidine kinase/phosphomethylpyrimidine kinase [Psychromonas marina]